MFYAGQSRADLRRSYAEAWRKQREGAMLSPLEAQLATVIGEHPEYHRWLEGDAGVEAEFTPESGQSNPFLHLGMHLALRDQVATDRPPGIRAVHARLAARHGAHEAEHRMMEALGAALWEAQRSGRAPDEARYLEQLRQNAGAR
jgi:hypothetical protein